MQVLQKPGSPDLDSRDPTTGETALHIVVRRHDQAWLSALLARGAKTDLRDNGGDTPLMAAAKLSDAESLRTLLSFSANPNATDTQGQTPLIVAVQRRDMPSIRLLLAGGADPRIADRVAAGRPGLCDGGYARNGGVAPAGGSQAEAGGGNLRPGPALSVRSVQARQPRIEPT